MSELLRGLGVAIATAIAAFPFLVGVSGPGAFRSWESSWDRLQNESLQSDGRLFFLAAFAGWIVATLPVIGRTVRGGAVVAVLATTAVAIVGAAVAEWNAIRGQWDEPWLLIGTLFWLASIGVALSVRARAVATRSA